MKKELEDSQAKKLQQLFEEVTNHEVTEEVAAKDGVLQEAEEELDVSEQKSATEQPSLTEKVIESKQTETEREEVEGTEAADDISDEVVEERTEASREIKFAYEEMDVLNLPPRSEVHSQSKTRVSLSMKKPTSRFILVLLFLIVIMAVIYFFYEDEIMTFINELLR